MNCVSDPKGGAVALASRQRAGIVASFLAILAVGSCRGDGPSPPLEPEPPLKIGIDGPVTGTVSRGGTKVLYVEAKSGYLFRVHFQALSGSATDSLVLTITADSNGAVLGELSSVGTQETLEERVLFVPQAAADFPLFLTVRGAGEDDGGAFRVMVRLPGLAPEHVLDTIQVGDSIFLERIDSEGDRDRFRVSMDSGAEYVLALGMAATRQTKLSGLVLAQDTATRELVAWSADWLEGTLEQRAVRFRPTTTEWWRIDVTGSALPGSYVSGPVFPGGYKLWVRQVDSLPEGRPSQVTLGDTITEAIDPIGDEDVYRFAATAGDLIRIDAAIARELSSAIELRLIGPADFPTETNLSTPPARLDGTGWSFRAEQTTNYRVRLRGGLNAPRDSLTTQYRLEIRRIDEGPENASATIGPSDTIAVESIERAGDVDEFTLPLSERQLVEFRLVPVSAIDGRIDAVVNPGPGSIDCPPLVTGSIGCYIGILGRASHTTRIRISGLLSSIGAYRIETAPLSADPELVSGSLPIGAWIGGETLAPAADMDFFEFPAAAGGRYNVLIDRDPGATGDPLVHMLSPVSVFFTSPDRGGAVGAFTAPVNGVGSFHVSGALSGGYRLMVVRVDSQPETILPAIAIGDTIVGELIDVPGDLDEFVMEGTVGDRLRFAISALAPNPDRTFRLGLYHPVSGALLLGINESSVSDTFELPVTGGYRVRVFATPDTRLDSTGAYRFSATRVP